MKKVAIHDAKFESLVAHLEKLGKVAVAFSGGVDSSFLMAVAAMTLGDGAVGITVDSPALPRHELEDAGKVAALVGAAHVILHTEEIEEEVRLNPVDRCYFCKKGEFGAIKEEAARRGIWHVLDGSNADDVHDYRPGTKARDEVRVASPLQELAMTKQEIRQFSKALALPTWDKPAYACLFSRIPYGTEIRREDLEKVEKSEKFLMDRGFRTVRVRCHGDLARIEVAPADRMKVLRDPLAGEIAAALKSFGFRFITVDILGYRMGSLNEAIGRCASGAAPPLPIATNHAEEEG